MATRIATAWRAPGPIGTAWRRTSSGELTTSTSGSSSRRSSAFQVPCSSMVSPACSTMPPASRRWPTAISAPPRCTARMIRSPLSVTMPGKTVSPDQARARRDHHFGEAGAAVEQRLLALPRRGSSSRKARCICRRRRRPPPPHRRAAAGGRPRRWPAGAAAGRVALLDGDELQPGIAGEVDARRRRCRQRAKLARTRSLVDAAGQAVLLDQRPGMAAEVGGHGRAVALGQQPLSEQHDDRHRPGQQRHADEREFEEAEAADAGIARRLPRPARSPACRSAPASSRHARRRPAASAAATEFRFSRTAMTTTTGSSAATAPLTLISAVSSATSAIVSTSSRVRLSSPAPRISSCPAQAVTPVISSPALTMKSEAMKMTAGSPKPPSAWSSVRTPVAHSASAVAMATMTTGSLFQTNRTTATAMMAAVCYRAQSLRLLTGCPGTARGC